MSKFLKNTLIIAIAILLLYGAYSLLSGGSDFNEDLLSSQKLEGIDSVDKSLISLLLELRSITLDESIFESSVFKSLNDFGIEIEPQPIGRENPFSSLGSDPEPEE